jgi:hypothetical protein
VSMSFLVCCGPSIKPDNIIYFRLLHNQGGRFKIVSTIGYVLCVLLFMNEFMPSMLIAILLFLESKANLGLRKSMFHHCVASIGCLIISTSYFCVSLCHHNNFDSFFCKLSLQTRNDRKVPKHLFSPAFSSVAVLVIITIFSMNEPIESTNRAFLKVFMLSPTI